MLLGGDGRDMLLGQQDNDMLEGGADEDRLTGGLGTDELRGGLGRDVYYVHSVDGSDTIDDSDGLGLIQIDQRLLVGGVRKPTDAAQTYRTPDGQFRYVLSGDSRMNHKEIPVDSVLVHVYSAPAR